MTNKPQTYIGIDNDIHYGMTAIGKIIRDARVFGIIPETETCEGWRLSEIDALLDKVNAEWDKYGCMVSHLPDDLKQRHEKIHGIAIKEAKASGWSGELEIYEES